MEVDTDVTAQVQHFLVGKEERFTALEIAKGIGLSTAKEVNPVLYKLEKRGELVRMNEKGRPLWCLSSQYLESPEIKLQEQAVMSIDEPFLKLSNNDNAEAVQILALFENLKQGEKLDSCTIASRLTLERKTVNKHLYQLQREGRVRQCEGSRWAQVSGTTQQDAAVELKAESLKQEDISMTEENILLSAHQACEEQSSSSSLHQNCESDRALIERGTNLSEERKELQKKMKEESAGSLESIQQILENLNTGESVPASYIRKELNLPMKDVNRHLYQLLKENKVGKDGTLPPRWFLLRNKEPGYTGD
ncbi:uncharacterized protein LOC114646788 [Erpetoichthys calabaricus]|uniref:uncharacterized protein LOC114646788 n=1 Tax=Erpetoichthys calabaricus TaxID=27687 RepID=UPI00109F5D42|nr:uncharacterized protein LOC114646788 [Erpetoichthys calabaricus]XP_028650960.1 uncharacterized protein LOC114646788 [Erpetoichthys calabaricus]XP_051779975.1 uncharacterized protein LOC114646788 [Erpetoichthys calabaricus]